MEKTEQMKKLYELFGINKLDGEAQPEAKKLLTQMVAHKKAGPTKEQMYLYLTEQFCQRIGAGRLSEKDQIDLRKKLDTLIEVIAHQEMFGQKDLNEVENLFGKNLFEHYFRQVDTSGIKTIDKKQWKFKEPELDMSDILKIKKSEFRFDKDKDNLMGGLI